MSSDHAPSTPFIIVSDLRTGSTLLSSSLNRHPQIRCYGELFHSDDFPDNRIDGFDRRDASSGEVLRRAMDAGGARAVGFKAMAFLPFPSERQWTDAWDRIRELSGLRVLYLTRQNRLAQYASLQVAQHTGVFHPYDNDGLYRPENRPTITIDPAAFHAWVQERDAIMERRRRQHQGLPALELTYEVLSSDWGRTMARVQAFLSVEVQPLEQTKKKQERRPLAEVIANYDELVAAQP